MGNFYLSSILIYVANQKYLISFFNTLSRHTSNSSNHSHIYFISPDINKSLFTFWREEPHLQPQGVSTKNEIKLAE
jgi:hypothetical protein